MIELPAHVDLGHDTTRIKDIRDAERQTYTVTTRLERMFHADPAHRWETQIVADEVGMGKTFVALATAYAILHFMREQGHPADLRGCMQKIVVITPQNKALHRKWVREVSEFVRRCVVESEQDAAKRWYQPQQINRPDELVCALRDSKGPRILVTHTGALSAHFKHYDLKRQVMLAALFRFWGNRLRIDARERLLKGAPEHWPWDSRELGKFHGDRQEKALFSTDTLIKGLRRLERKGGESVKQLVEQTFELCQLISKPYRRDRESGFRKLESKLTKVYRRVLEYLVTRSIPLVIVDEAHNWKNGPSQGTNNYQSYVRLIGRRTRRLLMLTATPFQLNHKEMVELLRIGETISPTTTEADNQARREAMHAHTQDVIKPVLDSASKASLRFSRAWGCLPRHIKIEHLKMHWQSAPLTTLREQLHEMAALPGVIDSAAMNRIIEQVVSELNPDVRDFMREALRLFTVNTDLSKELGKIVIRHRRDTRHRLFRVGEEAQYDYPIPDIAKRPDAHVLHGSAGIDVRGEGELPHYLLMRCVSEMKGGKGRSSLGSALTGCYSTLLHSAEGKQVKRALTGSALGNVYLDLLMNLVGEKHDHEHPKMRAVVAAILEAWRQGDKILIFCFRTNTARRLREITHQAIHRELDKRRRRCLGGKNALKTLRSRLTARDRDLVGLGLDRVLWSVLWATRGDGQLPVSPEMFRLTDRALGDLAYLGLRYGQNLTADRVDRVFLHRATEHLIARQLGSLTKLPSRVRALVERIRDESWVQRPYGVMHRESDDDGGGEDHANYDERGVHTAYVIIDPSPDDARVERVAEELRARRERAKKTGQIPIIDGYAELPSLWLGVQPDSLYSNGQIRLVELLEKLHRELWELSWDNHDLALDQRLYALQSLRRTLLRESLLLRLLPDKIDLEEAGWGELLVGAFLKPMPGQRESMADRIAVFVEDLRAASGRIGDTETARHALWDATRLREQQYVALVSGDTATDTRDRIFNGFNTPLLPEVLVCTSVGQEGIDLHRHCRQVVHYDLAWNPATLEQRTGRADRIGSKTSRERELGQHEHGPYLEVAVPFLAGTYDERMYEELRLRAQTFEVLTGGDLSVDYDSHAEQGADEEGKGKHHRFVALPESLVCELRVSLCVWHG